MKFEKSKAGGDNLRVISVIPYDPRKNSMVFAKRQIECLAGYGVINNIFLLTSRLSLPKLYKEFKRLRHEIGSFHPDIVHAHFGTVTAFISVMASDVPVIITFRGSDLNRSGGVNFLKWISGHLLSQISALKADRIICVSEELKNILWWKKGDAVVLPTGVDTSLFVPEERNKARSRLGWQPGERIVLFNAGSNPANKRLDLAESSVRLAEAVIGKISLKVLDGNTEPDEVPIYMNAADCLLLTSDKEGSPTVVQEALACNLPVISVPVGDVRKRLSGVVPSIMVEREPNEICKAIVEILSAPQRSNGREFVNTLSLEYVTKEVVKIYHAVLKSQLIK
jgi:teichuronic acid biosynthesis glycosyltransferase TuaC